MTSHFHSSPGGDRGSPSSNRANRDSATHSRVTRGFSPFHRQSHSIYLNVIIYGRDPRDYVKMNSSAYDKEEYQLSSTYLKSLPNANPFSD